MRRNLFIGIPNDKLQECYRSHNRVLCNRKKENELFEELVLEYQTIVECDESKKEKVANAIASSDMFNEIARRYFKIYNLVHDEDFCDMFGILQNERPYFLDK